jgi:5'(3')-deoxyribonucleotidase
VYNINIKKRKEVIIMEKESKIFLDMDGTLARFNVPNALKRFDNEIGFFAKLGAYRGIEVINELAKKGNVYIISASPNVQADNDKMQWIEKYLPNVKIENITLCRLGENKAKIIENKYNIKIDKTCYLLDDYTKNLTEWETVGGVGIKRLTHCADNSRGLWKGLAIAHLNTLQMVVA